MMKVRRNLTAKETDESVRWLSYLLVPEGIKQFDF